MEQKDNQQKNQKNETSMKIPGETRENRGGGGAESWREEREREDVRTGNEGRLLGDFPERLLGDGGEQ